MAPQPIYGSTLKPTTNFIKLQQQRHGEAIARKSRLYSLAPVVEMIKRGWISGSDSVDELEKAV